MLRGGWADGPAAFTNPCSCPDDMMDLIPGQDAGRIWCGQTEGTFGDRRKSLDMHGLATPLEVYIIIIIILRAALVRGRFTLSCSDEWRWRKGSTAVC